MSSTAPTQASVPAPPPPKPPSATPAPPRGNAAADVAGKATGAAAAQAPVEVRVAGFWWRLAAAAIDLALLSLPAALFWYVVRDHLPKGLAAGIDFFVDMILLGDGVVHAGILLMPLLAVVYFTVTTGLMGTSPGKWVLGLRVVDRRGDPAGFLLAAIRALAYVPGFLLCGLGFFYIAVDRRKRGLQDLLAGTLVVRRAAGPAKGRPGGPGGPPRPDAVPAASTPAKK
jgi:uncharacterized RDD family membrane protein YckC